MLFKTHEIFSETSLFKPEDIWFLITQEKGNQLIESDEPEPEKV